MARPALLALPVAAFVLWAVSRSRRPSSAPARGSSPAPSSAPFQDSRRLNTLDAIVPAARPAFEALLTEARRRGFRPSVISAVRTCEEQRQVKSVPRSWHMLGRAIDLELPGGTPEEYTSLGEWWEAQGGTWGGRWTEQYPVAPCGPVGMRGDPCHFQFTPGLRMDDVWPSGEACETVTARYLAEQGGAWNPAEGWRAVA